MNKSLVLVITLVALSLHVSSSRADDPVNAGPEVIKLKMGNSAFPFKHKLHQVKLNNECYHCHKTKSGIIDNWGEQSAHTLCIACHDLYDNGPVDCKGCHTK